MKARENVRLRALSKWGTPLEDTTPIVIEITNSSDMSYTAPATNQFE